MPCVDRSGDEQGESAGGREGKVESANGEGPKGGQDRHNKSAGPKAWSCSEGREREKRRERAGVGVIEWIKSERGGVGRWGVRLGSWICSRQSTLARSCRFLPLSRDSLLLLLTWQTDVCSQRCVCACVRACVCVCVCVCVFAVRVCPSSRLPAAERERAKEGDRRVEL